MAQLAVASAARGPGVDLAGVAAAGGGDSFPNTGQEIFVIKNGSGSPITCTAVIQAKVDGQAAVNLATNVAAGATVAIGPFPQGVYNDVTGLVQFTYSAVTTVTVKVMKVTPA